MTSLCPRLYDLSIYFTHPVYACDALSLCYTLTEVSSSADALLAYPRCLS